MIGPLLLAVALRPLAEGTPSRESLGAGEKAAYTFSLAPETVARIAVQQDGIDIRASLVPAGVEEASDISDMANGVRGEEVVVAPASAAPSTWTVMIEPVLPSAERGNYSIAIQLMTAGDRADALARAKRNLREGRDARAAGDKASVEKAIAAFDAAAAEAHAAAEPELEAEGIYQAALAVDLTGDSPAAVERLDRALPIMRAAGLRDREGRTLDRLGDLARKMGQVGAAEEHFADALPIVREVHDPEAEADVLNNHGLLLSSTARWDEAITMFEQAVPIAHATGSLDVEAALHHNLGYSYSRAGDYALAIDAYQQSLELKRRMHSPRRVAATLNNLATVYSATGKREQAMRTIREALELWDVSGDRNGKESSLIIFGRMSHAAGDDEQAIGAFRKAIAIGQAIGDRRGVASALAAWAEIDMARGDAGGALAKLDRALPVQRETLDRRAEAETLYLRAVALRKNGRIADAIESVRGSIAVVETLRERIARDELRSSYLATVRRYYDLHIALVLQRGGADSAAEAFAIAERGRARTLLDGLAESAAKIRKGVDGALLDRERSLQREIDARESYHARLLSSKNDRAAAVGREITHLVAQLESTEAEIRRSSKEYAALEMPDPVNAADVQNRLLDDRTTLVAYRLAPGGSHVWTVDRRGIHVERLAPEATIEAMARKVYALLSGERSVRSAAESRRLQAAERTLSNAVLAPIAERLRGQRLVVIADGALQYIPFAALPLPHHHAPLLTRFEIDYTPSASVLLTIRERRRRQSDERLAVFADPVFTRDDPRLQGHGVGPAGSGSRAAAAVYPRLRFSRAEAEAIFQAAGGYAKLRALDFDAAKKTLLAANLSRYRILHFATHGILNSEHPQLSGLVLSLYDEGGRRVDGFLRLHEIYNLDLDAELVVLSACKTALGKEIHGEGLIGLTRGFIYAGADRVVASVWNVDDRASALLMARFYREMLGHDTTAAAALRRAQLSMLREPRWSDPHDWAAFTLQGEWR